MRDYLFSQTRDFFFSRKTVWNFLVYHVTKGTIFPVGWTNPSQSSFTGKYEIHKKKRNGGLFAFLTCFTCFGVARRLWSWNKRFIPCHKKNSQSEFRKAVVPEGVLKNVLYGEAPPPRSNPLPFYIPFFFSEKAPLSYTFYWKKAPLNKSLKQEVFSSFFSRSA